MKAAVIDRYGPPEVVELRDVEEPRPTAKQILVRVESATVDSADARIRGARFPRGFALGARLAFGVRRPRRPILGTAFAGTVVEVGSAATGVRVGDRVAGMSGFRLGCHAELVAVPATKVAPVPDAVSAADAAGVLFGGTTALHFLRACRVVPGRPGHAPRVLVVGGAGAVGVQAIQLARASGATVRATAGPGRAALLAELGAEHLDHSRDELFDGSRYDAVLDTVGLLDARSARRLLTDDGHAALIAADLPQTLRARGRVHTGTASERAEDVAHLLELLADRTVRVVGDRLGFDEIVEAHRRVDSGHKTGSLVLTW
ncbi:NAD(P)-dependent alcohol dehydrogenase [Nocardioides dubius]|uniref:NAD(P)-dependent alcohol dehydrogenase n=1 Tax=Nocardioides dubius TaxID=317019 RepID=A0ABP4EAL6_9ACTN